MEAVAGLVAEYSWFERRLVQDMQRQMPFGPILIQCPRLTGGDRMPARRTLLKVVSLR